MRTLARALKDRGPPILLRRQRIRLGHHILQLDFNLLFGEQESLPELVADGAALQELGEGGLGVADLDEAVNVFCGAAEEGGAEDGVGDFGVGAVGSVAGRGLLEFEEGEVDVALEVGREPRG